MTLLFSLLYMLIDVFDLLLLVYCVISWVPGLNNQWTAMLGRIMEPVLMPIRRAVARVLGRQLMIDISPIVAWVLLRLVRRVLAFLL